MPTWVRLGDKFDNKDLLGMPRIDGALLRKAINLFKNNKSCGEDSVVSEMLRVLDEDVLDFLAEAIETRVLNRENDKEGAYTTTEANSRFVQFPYDENIDMRDGISNKRRRSTVHVDKWDGYVVR